jgi:hypothetical protein
MSGDLNQSMPSKEATPVSEEFLLTSDAVQVLSGIFRYRRGF